jgi:protein phosphatase
MLGNASGSGSDAYLPGTKQIAMICQAAIDEFQNDAILLYLTGHFVVVGDIHGNFDDLLRIFEENGYPPSTRYLFLGDYVDRGHHSIEVLLLLYSLKALFPTHIFMLRGNHEYSGMTEYYGFKNECLERLTYTGYLNFLNVFQYLPLVGVLNSKIFCVHGGIPTQPISLEDLELMEKPVAIPLTGVVADMLWSDPNPDGTGFTRNARGAGSQFGGDEAIAFLEKNGLEMIVRSHEMCIAGFDWPYRGDPQGAEACLTIFSTPNYCDQGNQAAVLHVDACGDFSLNQFSAIATEDRSKRRVLLPKWLIDDATPVTADDESSPDSEPNTPPFDEFEFDLLA